MHVPLDMSTYFDRPMHSWARYLDSLISFTWVMAQSSILHVSAWHTTEHLGFQLDFQLGFQLGCQLSIPALRALFRTTPRNPLPLPHSLQVTSYSSLFVIDYGVSGKQQNN